MNTLRLLRERFSKALEPWGEDSAALAQLVLPSQDRRYGDYQANCAMPLAKRLGQPPRELAEQIIARLDLAELCHAPEVAGPGFINLRLREDWLALQLARIGDDEERLAVSQVDDPKKIVIDYSSPNIAKPMHVGHIRSTVIGDSLYRILRFLGNRTISDNHVGDWGTQFGMILYGYKHFRDVEHYREHPVEELSRLYKLVQQLVAYHETTATLLPALDDELKKQEAAIAALASESPSDPQQSKRHAKMLRQAQGRLSELQAAQNQATAKLTAVEESPELAKLAESHPQLAAAVLEETAKLHAGDKVNRSLWQEFLTPCMEEIQQTYDRLGVSFNHTLGESFYQNRLADVVADLEGKGIAQESEGALCVFFEDHTAPLIVKKSDGAFLYATTDLATIQYRMEEFHPHAILYVVDHRQSLHFEQLFAAARRWGYTDVELTHVEFGTVLGEDGKPFKTRSGQAVGLSSLLDEAVAAAYQAVCQNDDQRDEPLLSDEQRRQVAEKVGIGAIKYADLAHNRTSDYVFSYEKMLAMNGNTATYMQYCYARIKSIFAKGEVFIDALRHGAGQIRLDADAERALGLQILRFDEALQRVALDYRPNHLTAYLFDLASRFSDFYESCPVHVGISNEAVRQSRLLLCDLTARTIRKGLSLLGIEVVERM